MEMTLSIHEDGKEGCWDYKGKRRSRWNMECGDKVLTEEVTFNSGDEATDLRIWVS